MDHSQFIVDDGARGPNPDAYTDASHWEGAAVWDGGFAVTTASSWTRTVVTLALCDARPGIDLAAWEHAVEAGLRVDHGELHVYGPEGTGESETVVSVRTGEYSALICGSGFDTPNELGGDGNDEYAVWLWPGPVLPRRVVKDGLTRLRG